MALYKYLPSQYADAFLRGEILFRNLSYFKRLDCRSRGDATEGIHRDRPEGGATLENLSMGGTVYGDFTSLNEIDSDLVFVFCTSEIFDEALFHEFEADCCIEIDNLRIPRHSATHSSMIRPPAPRTSGRISRSEATQELQVNVLV